MANINRVIERQHELFGIIARTITNLNKLGSANINRGTVESRMNALKSNWAKFQKNHEDMFDVRTEEEKKLEYFTNNLYSACEEEFLFDQGILLEHLDIFDRQVPATVSVIDAKTRTTSGSHSRRLPQLDLPKFSGDNFARAWDTLITRYDNKRLLINSQLTILFASRKIRPGCLNDLKRMLGEVKAALGALEVLGCPIDQWDPIIVFLVVQKLDADLLKDWNKKLGKSPQPPSFADLEAYLVDELHALDALEKSNLPRKPQPSTSGTSKSFHDARVHLSSISEKKCSLCSDAHYISSCPNFLAKDTEQRRAFVLSKRLCFNCLGPHPVKACRKSKRCRLCSKQHHSTLHLSNRNSIATTTLTSSSSTSNNSGSTSHVSTSSNANHEGPTSEPPFLPPETHTFVASHFTSRNANVLLATAVVYIISPLGERLKVCALLDRGSEASFISESVVQVLQLPRRAAAVPIIGIGALKSSTSNGVVSLRLTSYHDSAATLNIEALVLPKLTAYLPPRRRQVNSWSHLRDLQLADPYFSASGKIDLILGAEAYAQILEDGIRKRPVDAPIAQKTKLGWVLSGALANPNPSSGTTTSSPIIGLQCSLDKELLELLRRFWTLEEVATSSETVLTQDESQCEEHFASTYSRDPQGRFVVRLPLKPSAGDLGDSRTPALRALVRLEKRFEANSSFKGAYTDFLREYFELNHMQPCGPLDHKDSREFYLPHHGVVRELNSVKKLRVVFNGSQKTNHGISLNECLHIGPKQQTDISDVILRWRRHQFAFASDIEKMYRQIRVHHDDQPLQKILWRNSPDDPPQSYKLCTVTYGLACAPYLALRCLLQLAKDSAVQYPLASLIIRNDTYVDDILSGASDISTAKLQICQLRDALKTGGFCLKKWISNHQELLSEVPLHDQENTNTMLVDDGGLHHTLGIQWNCRSDHFILSAFSTPNSGDAVTKRAVLSFISRMFDPLGWASPIIILAKTFLQELWVLRVDWDEDLPAQLCSRWNEFIQQCQNAPELSIPRWIGSTELTSVSDLQGFADASQTAIAAVVYVRIRTSDDSYHVSLLAAKTKVAPLKRMTIPRLELSATVLLVRLITKLRDVLELSSVPIHLWTDSSVALSWINGHPSKWKDFVRNRVTVIQELSNSQWHHISGKENPADLASRGLSPTKLQKEQLWWTGPQWLRQPQSLWPSSPSSSSCEQYTESRVVSCVATTINPEEKIWSLINRYSSLTRLLRITAWLQRAINKFRKASGDSLPKIPLTPAELDSALLFWTKLTQQAFFAPDIQALSSLRPLPASSSILRLAPFLDSDGLLRLRGRLNFSRLAPDSKNPLLLPRASRLTQLVIDYYHHRTLHGGPQLTLSAIRQKFWVIGGRVPVRAHIHRCVVCVRHRVNTGQQLIGQLPSTRVTPSRPFLHTGVNYAGPITMKTIRGRGSKTYKGYFIVFICFSSSAIHLEVSTDYTTQGFIAAYKRFVARRGLCSTITSDCGTNLVGADAELRRMFTASSRAWAQIADVLANDGVSWRFNPPAAPHFGGKWEAGVKSVKFHLRRVLGDAVLTYEELATLLAQIEAILNSRPLTALSEDPSDIAALTPGHFLVGSALTAIPEPSLLHIPDSRLSRWQLLQKMTESLWRRWSSEYLHHLQTSSKWHRKYSPSTLGALVLLKDERFPPTKWPLARIVAVHPGVDKFAW